MKSTTDVAAQAALRFLQDRPGWSSATGYLADEGPLEDRIDPVAVRTAGFGSDVEIQLVFEHRAFPGQLFGLRSGPLWTDDDGNDEPLHGETDPEDIGFEFGNWAEDFPFLHGLDVDARPDSTGVIWLTPTWRDDLLGSTA